MRGCVLGLGQVCARRSPLPEHPWPSSATWRAAQSSRLPSASWCRRGLRHVLAGLSQAPETPGSGAIIVPTVPEEEMEAPREEVTVQGHTAGTGGAFARLRQGPRSVPEPEGGGTGILLRHSQDRTWPWIGAEADRELGAGTGEVRVRWASEGISGVQTGSLPGTLVRVQPRIL